MIKTWQQRCEEHPDHQQGIVTQQMIQDRMQEEIDELRQALAQPQPVQFKCTVVDDGHPNGVPLSQWGRQPEQEPVAWMDKDGDVLSASIVDGTGLRNIPLYTAPPRREWVGITKEDKKEILEMTQPDERGYVIAITEAKLKEKNT